MKELRLWLGRIAVCATAFPPGLWAMTKLGGWLITLGPYAPMVALFAVGVASGLAWLVLTMVLTLRTIREQRVAATRRREQEAKTWLAMRRW